jgi:hypothetical protein
MPTAGILWYSFPLTSTTWLCILTDCLFKFWLRAPLFTADKFLQNFWIIYMVKFYVILRAICIWQQHWQYHLPCSLHMYTPNCLIITKFRGSNCPIITRLRISLFLAGYLATWVCPRQWHHQRSCQGSSSEADLTSDHPVLSAQQDKQNHSHYNWKLWNCTTVEILL